MPTCTGALASRNAIACKTFVLVAALVFTPAAMAMDQAGQAYKFKGSFTQLKEQAAVLGNDPDAPKNRIIWEFELPPSQKNFSLKAKPCPTCGWVEPLPDPCKGKTPQGQKFFLSSSVKDLPMGISNIYKSAERHGYFKELKPSATPENSAKPEFTLKVRNDDKDVDPLPDFC